MTEKWKEQKWAEDIWYSGKLTRRRIVGFFAEHLKPLSRTNPAYSPPAIFLATP